MPVIHTLSGVFNGGELTPEMWGNVTDSKYQSGLALCRNFIVLPHGPAANRGGMQFVRAVKDSTKKVRLLRFNYGVVGSAPQSFAVELGAGYFRFHTNGATLLTGVVAAYNGATAYVVGNMVLSGGVNYYCILATTGNSPPNATYWYPMPAGNIYEIPNPYAEADLFQIHYVQSNDVMTLAHPNYPTMELRRVGATNWQLTAPVFGSTLGVPGSVTATATVATGAGFITHDYVVTAVGAGDVDESLQSVHATCSNNLLTTGNKNTVGWAAVTGAVRYNVYKLSNGLYGFLGQTDQVSFIDDNITPDISRTPPISNLPFVGTQNYPGAVTYFQQRRAFAGTILKPLNFWMTKPGTESNINYSIPSRDNDAIQNRIVSREASRILHLIPLKSLIVLTANAELSMTSTDGGALTPDTVSIDPQSYIGSSEVQPVIVNNNLIFAAARGGHLRELAYQYQAGGYVTGDLSLRAPHLFDNKTIVDMSYSKSPQPVVWTPSSDGTLIGLTYVPEQQVGGFHWHDTYTGNGTVQSYFESTVVVEEGDADYQYVIVRRIINGSSVRYVERMMNRLFATQADAFFIDCGLTYSGAPATIITGLSHIEGETVNILADGGVHPQRIVTGGQITLQRAASKVQIGLPIEADLQLLPLTAQVEAFAQGRQKNINRVVLRVADSLGIFVGPDFDTLTEAKVRTDEAYGVPPALRNGEIDVTPEGNWTGGAQLCIRQSNPLPLTICSITMEVAVGG